MVFLKSYLSNPSIKVNNQPKGKLIRDIVKLFLSKCNNRVFEISSNSYEMYIKNYFCFGQKECLCFLNPFLHSVLNKGLLT